MLLSYDFDTSIIFIYTHIVVRRLVRVCCDCDVLVSVCTTNQMHMVWYMRLKYLRTLSSSSLNHFELVSFVVPSLNRS